MKLEQLTENADTIKTLEELNIIMEQPRQGRIYVYHQGMVANDKVNQRDLRGVSNRVNRLAEKNELMSFQKRMRDGRFLYFFVR
jgi:hypothetical protein